MVRTKKVSRNNSKNKVGGSGSSASRRGSRSASSRASASTSASRSESSSPSSNTSPNVIKKTGKLVISSVNKKLLNYFIDPPDKVKKLLAKGNKIIGLTTKYSDPLQEVLSPPISSSDFKREFNRVVNFLGDKHSKPTNITLAIEESLVTNLNDELPPSPTSISPSSNKFQEKLDKLFQEALLDKQKKPNPSGTLTLNLDKLKHYRPEPKAQSFVFKTHAGFDVKEEIIVAEPTRKPKRVVSDPGPKRRSSISNIKGRKGRNASSTKSAE